MVYWKKVSFITLVPILGMTISYQLDAVGLLPVIAGWVMEIFVLSMNYFLEKTVQNMRCTRQIDSLNKYIEKNIDEATRWMNYKISLYKQHGRYHMLCKIGISLELSQALFLYKIADSLCKTIELSYLKKHRDCCAELKLMKSKYHINASHHLERISLKKQLQVRLQLILDQRFNTIKCLLAQEQKSVTKRLLAHMKDNVKQKKSWPKALLRLLMDKQVVYQQIIVHKPLPILYGMHANVSIQTQPCKEPISTLNLFLGPVKK